MAILVDAQISWGAGFCPDNGKRLAKRRDFGSDIPLRDDKIQFLKRGLPSLRLAGVKFLRDAMG